MKEMYLPFTTSNLIGLTFVQKSIYTIVIVLAISFSTGCANLANYGNIAIEEFGNLNFFTDEEEMILGQKFVTEHNKTVVFYNDPFVNNYINDLGQYLVRYSKRKNIKYTFRVVQKKGVNAYAMPGGYIYIHLDLIRVAKNESELAAVIGHEIGHIVGQHSMKRLTQVYSIEILKKLILGEDPGELKKIVTEILASGLLSRYSRDDERESDALGVRNIYDAGISPEGAVTFFETLQSMRKREPTALEKFLSTHPIPRERVENIRDQINRLIPKPNLRTNSTRFQQVKRRI